MSMPFEIKKATGREDRILFESTPIDDYLTADQLRDIYFKLSGQAFKVGQTSCKKFPRKGDLLVECERLIRYYLANPKKWTEVQKDQDKKAAEREKRRAKKAAKQAAIQARVNERAAALATLNDEDFLIEIKALEIVKALRSSIQTSSDSE